MTIADILFSVGQNTPETHHAPEWLDEVCTLSEK